MLIRKNQLMGNKNAGLSTLERSSLNQKRTLAFRRHDFAEVAEIDAKLAEDAANTSEQPARKHDTHADMLTKVNERNRKANLEAVRKAELMESERKRRERRLGQSGGTPAPIDPSARLKVAPRTFIATPNATRFVFGLFLVMATDLLQTVDACGERDGGARERSVCRQGAGGEHERIRGIADRKH